MSTQEPKGTGNASTPWYSRYTGSASSALNSVGGYLGTQSGALSDFWRIGRRKTHAFTAGEPNPQVLARYLNTVRNTVRLVSGKKHKINWSRDGDSAYNPESGEIKISAQALADQNITWPEGERLDVITGLALHEASHGQYTPDSIMSHIRDDTLLKWTYNLVEDAYIEEEIRSEFPGFNGYLDANRKYFSHNRSMDERVKGLQQLRHAKSADEQMKLLVPGVAAACMHGIAGVDDDVKHLRKRDKINLSALEQGDEYDQAVAQALRKIRDRVRSIEQSNTPVSDRLDTARACRDELQKIMLELQQQQQQGDGGNGDEDQQQPSEQAIKQAFMAEGINEAAGFRESTRKDYNDPAKQTASGAAPGRTYDEGEGTASSSEGIRGKEALNPDQANNIEAIGEADVHELPITDFMPPNRSAGRTHTATLTTVNMKMLPYAREVYRRAEKKARKHEQRLRRALELRSSDRVYKERELRHGKLDSTRLANLAAYKSPDVFERTITSSAPSAHIAILVDESGSMGSGSDSEAERAREATIMLVNAISKIGGISYEVWGHSGSMSSAAGHMPRSEAEERYFGPVPGMAFNGPALMRYLSSPDGVTDARVLGRITGRSQNYDGFALHVVGDSIKTHMAERNVLILICDGAPGTIGMGNPRLHVRDEVNSLRKEGIETICLYVGSPGFADHLNEMFGREHVGWVAVPDVNDLSKAVEKIAKKGLKWEPSF